MPDHPDKDPLEHGFTQRAGSLAILPTVVAPGVDLVPDDLLKFIRCACSSVTRACKGQCKCKVRKMRCTIFCGCKNNEDICHNKP